MKKLALLLSLMVFCTIPVSAECDYKAFCQPHAYDLSSNFGRNVSNKIGATGLSERIAQDKIKSDLKKATNQNFDVVVKSYSFQDFMQGRFKSVFISGKNLEIDGAYLTSLELKTLCDFNYVQLNRIPVIFKENMVVGFRTEISGADLAKTMNSSGYLDRLNCVDVKGCGITFFKLSGANVKIENNKLYFTVRITSQLLLAKPLDVVLATDLKAEDGRIVLSKVDLGNLAKGVDLSKVASQLSEMNPLTFSLDVLENKNTKMCIKHVDIVEDKIIVEGNIFIPKNVKSSIIKGKKYSEKIVPQNKGR